MFLKKEGSQLTFMLIYVDDIIVGENEVFFWALKWQETDMVINQRGYAIDIINSCDMENCKPSNFPLELNLKQSKDLGESLSNPSEYRRLIGRI